MVAMICSHSNLDLFFLRLCFFLILRNWMFFKILSLKFRSNNLVFHFLLIWILDLLPCLSLLINVFFVEICVARRVLTIHSFWFTICYQIFAESLIRLIYFPMLVIPDQASRANSQRAVPWTEEDIDSKTYHQNQFSPDKKRRKRCCFQRLLVY